MTDLTDVTSAAPVISTKVVAATSAASIATALLSIATYYLGNAHLPSAVAVPLITLLGAGITGGVTFAAGYLRKELARLH